ncbi:hypothetical protein O181_092711 [Austropuccinia psidii MF-1]|uniref:Uncharacterized protein n=1 Tax=Austropuccinia psidii MF-1 TaxID=1389203 RepID=A0A9Q3PAW0_9BASI|nr:hypothetical protein [Austropuccinia psidii MF-1]
MKTPNQQILRWQVAIERYRGNIKVAHKDGNIHNNADRKSRWVLEKTPDNSDYVPLEAEPQSAIEGTNITEVETKFFEELRKSYKKDKNFHISTSLLDKDCKDTALVIFLDEI